VVLADLDVVGHEEGRDLLVLPDGGLAGSGELRGALDVGDIEVGVLLLLLYQRAEVETELGVDVRGLCLQQVVVEGASLHDAFACLDGDVHLEILSQHLRVQVPRLHVGHHGHNALFHREASLEAAAVGLSMVETAMVAAGVRGGVRAKRRLLLQGARVEPGVHRTHRDISSDVTPGEHPEGRVSEHHVAEAARLSAVRVCVLVKLPK